MNQWNHLALVAAVDPEVSAIHGDDAVARIQLAHPDETEIRQIRLAVLITFCQGGQLRQMVVDDEGDGDQSVRDHPEDDRNVLEMKCGFRQDGFARQERVVDLSSDANRPVVVNIAAIGKRDEETGIGDTDHARENPFRRERSFGPSMVPANRMNRRVPRVFRARSS